MFVFILPNPTHIWFIWSFALILRDFSLLSASFRTYSQLLAVKYCLFSPIILHSYENLIYFVFFIEIYQIWPENFEEIIVITNIKTVIPPDKQHEWVKRAKYQKTAHRPFSIDSKIVQNVIFSKNTTLQSVFL